jgi:restriction system protein
LPKFHETFNPILDILSTGKIIHHRELLKKVVDKYYSDLPKELLEQKTKSGETLILNRIAWGKSYLKKGEYIIYPERGMVQITEKGKKSITDQLQLKDVVGETNFLEFYTEEKTKGISNIKT